MTTFDRSHNRALFEDSIQLSNTKINSFNAFTADKNQQLDNELIQIENMKLMYNSKEEKRRAVKSSEKPITQSNQKHLLKPSVVPQFNKKNYYEITEVQRRQSENRLKQYYEEAKKFSEKKNVTNFEHKSYTETLEEQLHQKKIQIEQQNKKYHEMEMQNQQFQHKLKEIMRENLKLRDKHQKIEMEKQGLENLLKDLLFERQKQKMLKQRKLLDTTLSKVTPPKPVKSQRSVGTKKSENTSQLDSQNRQSMNTNTSLQRLSQKNTEKADKKKPTKAAIIEQSKTAKVQSILDKLKIKVSRY